MSATLKISPVPSIVLLAPAARDAPSCNLNNARYRPPVLISIHRPALLSAAPPAVTHTRLQQIKRECILVAQRAAWLSFIVPAGNSLPRHCASDSRQHTYNNDTPSSSLFGLQTPEKQQTLTFHFLWRLFMQKCFIRALHLLVKRVKNNVLLLRH